MSLSCGFATNSIMPDMPPVRVTSRRCTNFRQPGCADRAADRRSLGGAALLQSQWLRSVVLLLGLIAALRLHLPFGPDAFWVLLALSDETR
jgi:hypothetical protein